MSEREREREEEERDLHSDPLCSTITEREKSAERRIINKAGSRFLCIRVGAGCRRKQTEIDFSQTGDWKRSRAMKNERMEKGRGEEGVAVRLEVF